MLKTSLFFSLIILAFGLTSQVFINEGCNKNFQTIQDEDGDFPDWIELYNAGSQTVNLNSFSLTDNPAQAKKWEFINVSIAPGEFKTVFCSGKNRMGGIPFQFGLSQTDYNPSFGWNTHTLSTPFQWDGVSNIVLNVCSYNNAQYTENSIVRQTATPFASTLASFIDASPAACTSPAGALYNQRPNLKINNFQIGNGTIQNTNTEYPAPYGNWYWGARHQILILASELQAAGVVAGPLSTIAFDVVSTIGELYTYVDFSITPTAMTELTGVFMPENGFQLHTNFKIDTQGESILLLNPDEVVISQLPVQSPVRDVSIGCFTDGTDVLKWLTPTPAATNNSATTYTDTLISPVFSFPSGVYASSFGVTITNPNSPSNTKLVYTLDGSTPSFNSTAYTSPIAVNATTVLRAKVYPLTTDLELLPSDNTVATYLFNVSHTTPIILVTTDETNLYGANGIFDNYNSDWLKPAHAAYLSEVSGHPLAFETNTAIRPDGGAGGSRSQPQHSFRLSFAHSALGEKPVEYPIIPDRPYRTTYSDVYLRNGSNQYLALPYKDASQVRMMSEGTKNYYSSYRPATVYINGQYFGLYELREKFNKEYFEIHDGADPDSIELLSLSYFYNLVLRAVEGNVGNFWNSYDSFLALNPADANYFTQADNYFDLKHYTDYIIGESWMGNVDWPGNNIKIYRSDKTQNRWRFGLIDLELSMQPNGWTSCTDNHIRYMLDRDPNIPYINIWLRSITNEVYRNYFINRYADQMNTSYKNDKIQAFEQAFFNGMFPEMPMQYARWGDPNNIQGQMDGFIQNHLTFKSELACRNNIVRSNLVSEFNLEKQITLQLSVSPDSSGTIKLNTIQPEVYPWTGIYFDGVPVTMNAIPKAGFLFSHWEPNGFITDTLNPVFEGNVSENTPFKAYFNELPPPVDGPEIHFSLYPNPASNQLILSHDNKTQAEGCLFEIYDLNGRILYEAPIDFTSNTTLIDLSKLRASLYFVKIKKNSATVDVIRFIKN
jgi:hypothetical protein